MALLIALLAVSVTLNIVLLKLWSEDDAKLRSYVNKYTALLLKLGGKKDDERTGS